MTANQGVELGLEQRTVCTVKTAGLTFPFMISCARHPIHGNNRQRRSLSDSSWANTAFGQRLTTASKHI